MNVTRLSVRFKTQKFLRNPFGSQHPACYSAMVYLLLSELAIRHFNERNLVPQYLLKLFVC
jgi:hypothetical protein